MALAQMANTAEAIGNLFIKEQFMNLCPRELTTRLHEKTLVDLHKMARVVEKVPNSTRYAVPHDFSGCG